MSSVLSTLPLMILPSSLLDELVDICKLLVSDAKMPGSMDEEHPFEDEEGSGATEQLDLFEAEGDGSHSRDTHCGPGQNLQLNELFTGYVLLDECQ